ncbi:MAG: hypothetical protein WDZ76_14680 [Pseudohongiellaceae bacterium]
MKARNVKEECMRRHEGQGCIDESTRVGFGSDGGLGKGILSRAAVSVAFAALLTSCAGMVSNSGLPDRIVAERGGFIPEGIEYDNNNRRLLTGSLAEGTVYAIGADGSMTPVVEDSALISSVGIEVDEARNRLLVANSDRSSDTGAARLGVYHLDSGDPIAMVDLVATIPDRPDDATHFANDVAVSTAGVIYVTDTRMNIVYQVDTYYQGQVFYDFGRNNNLNLNGIEYHPAGFLLVVSPGSGQLLRIPVNNPGRWDFVELSEPAGGGDGIFWAADGTLAVVSNNSSRVLKYASDDNWRTAEVVDVAQFEGQATTGAAVGNDIYVVQPHFADSDPPVILRAGF